LKGIPNISGLANVAGLVDKIEAVERGWFLSDGLPVRASSQKGEDYDERSMHGGFS
jgi:hypothetical protein